MKRLVPIPSEFLHHLKQAKETGIGYLVISVGLKDGRVFDQVATSEGYVIEVRGIKKFRLRPRTWYQWRSLIRAGIFETCPTLGINVELRLHDRMFSK
jgi:hypothetical protein